MATIAVIGTGEIGSRLCGHLVDAAHVVTAFDQSPTALAAAVARGARSAPSARHAVADAEFCLLALGDEKDVLEVTLGSAGIVEVLPTNAVIIDTTSSHPAVTLQVGAAAADRGIAMLDAPLSRGVEAAEKGTLSVMVGGNPSALERCRPILETFGSDIYYAGSLGCGHTAKALNMLLLGVALVATAEAVEMGRHAGIPEKTILDVFNASSGESYASSFHFPRFIATRSFDSGFTLGLMEKDIRIGIEAARSAGVVTPMFDRLWTIYRLMLQKLGPTIDNTHITRYLEVLGDVH